MKKLLIVTASVGAGHNQAARALMEEFAGVPGLTVQCVDAMDYVPRAFRLWYAGGYAISVTRFPGIYGWGFDLSNRPHTPDRGLGERVRLWVERHMLTRLGRLIDRVEPDLILNTHFFPAPYLARQIDAGRVRCPQAVVITDIEMHRFWYSENVARWFAPADKTAERLGRWGIPAERITVSGIPILPRWEQSVDRRRVLDDWVLPHDRKIVVLSGGTVFVCGPVVRLARQIARRDDVMVLVSAGRNKGLLARVACLPEAPDRIRAIAFTDRISELVGVSSLMVTKAGGVTTAECLAAGTPMLLSRPVPGQEGGNAEWMARHGAGVIARRYRDVPALAHRLLSDPSRLEKLAATARSLYRPGRRTVAAEVCGMLDLAPPRPGPGA